MSTKDKTVILPNDPTAATLQTVTGWVSRDGRFYGDDERLARWAGSTHVKCDECDAVMEKLWIKCRKCREKKAHEAYLKFPEKEWDGVSPLALHDTDTYFWDWGDVVSYAEDTNQNPSNLCLVFCTPIKPALLDANEMFCDQLAEDGEVEDDAILAAIEALNQAIKNAKPFSWYPGKVKADVSKWCAEKETKEPNA
jgi:hypothetical protein